MLDVATGKESQTRIYVINLRGRIDSVTSRDFERFYEDLFRSGHRYFIFDASRLEFISSAGISTLVRFATRLEKWEGACVLLHLNDEIRLTLEFFGLDRRLPISRSLEEAKEQLNVLIHAGVSGLEMAAHTGGTPEEQDSTSGAKRRAFPSVREYEEQELLPEEDYSTVSSDFSLHRISSLPEVQAQGLQGEDERVAGKVVLPAESSVEAKRPPEKTPEQKPLPIRDQVSDQMPDRKVEQRQEQKPWWDVLPEAQPVEPTALHDGFVVVRCEQCGVNLRVYQQGRHMCPECGIELFVKADGSASFYEKL